jgi:hypothetical protein
LVIQWLWLSIRYRGATVPCAANPHIVAGGLVGEGKLEYFEGMGPIARAATARFAPLSTAGQLTSAQLDAAVANAGLAFPLIAKPNLGLCGYGVCRIDDAAALRRYVDSFPRGEVIVLQEYLPQDNEAGIFYVREPGSPEGRVIGIALRYFPVVKGDGQSTLGQLVERDPRARRALGSARHSCRHDLDRVPAAGEAVRLSTIGSTRVGGLYRDGAAALTPALSAAIDAIARDMPAFHFGRFDVRFESLETLRAGRGFKIMEVNGAGSEAIHAWDPDVGLVDGFRTIFAKQRLLFEIGAANRARGARPIGLFALARLNARQNRLIDSYPASN